MVKKAKKEVMVLVKYSDNYADEFDCDGFSIMSQDEWDEHLRDVENYFGGCLRKTEVYFGTNEAMIYEDFDSYKRAFEVIHLPAKDLGVLLKHFGPNYGTFLTIDTKED